MRAVSQSFVSRQALDNLHYNERICQLTIQAYLGTRCSTGAHVLFLNNLLCYAISFALIVEQHLN